MKDIQLIFDFDDTIVSTNKEFERTNELVSTYISTRLYGNTECLQEVLNVQNRLDMEMVKSFGFVRPRYLLSWYATYEHFCKEVGQTPLAEDKQKIEELVNDIYIRRFENIPDSIPVLRQLKEQGYSMIILTAGEDEIQKMRVRQSGAFELVEEVIVYSYKTPETLKEVMQKYPAQQHVMIGNSLKSDIHPALENNVWGFHFERQTWDADHYEIDQAHPKYVHLSSLIEIPKKIEQVVLRNQSVAI